MEPLSTTRLRIGDWCVDATSGQISRDGETLRVEMRTMRLLLYLAERAGEVVSIEELLNRIWPEVAVSSDSVYQAVASLRRVLRDDPKRPTYIATAPRLGYRMVAAVGPWVEEAEGTADAPEEERLGVASESARIAYVPGGGRGRAIAWAGGVAICMTIGFALLARVDGMDVFLRKRAGGSPVAPAALPQRSIAVLPFLDLTEEMTEEPFADGMTEELIDRLSKIPGLRVPGATSSFYYKGKQVPIADIGRALGVGYVVDGSVRRSGARVRVAARLVRADNGYVVWSESYDRPFHDRLMVQDDIAGAVAKALRASAELNAR
jgi:TolB-like protein/DNA-binding winged helix-turn-helix (wHTH) protein